MFKLQITFVTLALISAVLSRPVPAPTQQVASSGSINALDIPGLSVATSLLGLGGGDGGDNEGDDNGSSSGGLLGLRQINIGADVVPSDLLAGFDPLSEILKRQDDEVDDGSDILAELEAAGLLGRQDFVGRAKRQDDAGNDSGDSDDNGADDTGDDAGDDSGDDNSRREDALAIPFLGGGGRRRYRGGLRGPPEHTGLAGLGDNLGDALTSLGKGLGQLLKRQDDSGDDIGDDSGDDNGDNSGDDNARREESTRQNRALPIPDLDGLIGPHEHTGLAGLGDNLGDALTSLGAGLGQLL